MKGVSEVSDIVSWLKLCAKQKDLKGGIKLHADILRQGLQGNNYYVASSLIHMYAKCGALSTAAQLLDDLPVRNIVTWNALIAGYAQHCRAEEAMKCLTCMEREGLSPNSISFIGILKACGNVGAVDKGQWIHDEIRRRHLLSKDVVLATSLVDMYVKCGQLGKAAAVLQELPKRDTISWNALIAGYVQQGQSEDALRCFEQMKQEGISPSAITYTCILKACGSIGGVDKIEQICEEIVRQGLLQRDVMLGTTLVDMYVKCGAFSKAAQVLEELSVRDVISWSTLIAGYVQQEQGQEALKCFDRMQNEGLFSDTVTIIYLLKACGSIKALAKGKQIHDEIIRQGLLEKDNLLGTALVDMYAKCGALANADEVHCQLPFQDVVSWNAFIAGYAQQQHIEEALGCFEQMKIEGFFPDAVTFTNILKACGSADAGGKGEQIHNEVRCQGLFGEDIVLGNTMVNMYVKCGALRKAARVMDQLPIRDVASWNALIAGYANEEQGEEALTCYEQMHREGLTPNAVTFICMLKACGSIGAADMGEKIYEEILGRGLLGKDNLLGSSLINMYSRCGALTKAAQVIDKLPVRDVVSWSALIMGYAQWGHSQEALYGFEQMQHEGFSPDAVTFLCVLSACSHSGLLDEGQSFFEIMTTRHSISPDIEHYTCMVDLFARGGDFDKALAMIKKMPSSDHIAVWVALLGACTKMGDLVLGRSAFNSAVQIVKK